MYIFLRILLTALLGFSWYNSAAAQRYTILRMNTPTVKIAGRTLKEGGQFTLNPEKVMQGLSEKQWIKVRNEKTKGTMVLTKKTVCNNEKPWSLKDFVVSLIDYSTRKKALLTRSWTPTTQQYYDSRVQIADTLAFRLDSPVRKDRLYIAACTDGNFRERAMLPTSPDGTCLYLTRAIYGHHEPPTAATHVCILSYDLKHTDAAPDSLGYLLVEALPLELK